MGNELERIRGIGPAVAIKMNKAGVKTIEEIASSKTEGLAWIKGIGINSAKTIIQNANELLNLEKGIIKVLDEIKKNFVKSCPKCGGPMMKKYIIISPERRINANQCKLCKFYLPI